MRIFVPCFVIINPSAYESFKRTSLAQQKLTLDEKFRILDALYEEARRLGRFGPSDILDGLEDDIRLATSLNANVSEPPR